MPVASIDRCLILDNPDSWESEENAEEIGQSVRSGISLPAIVVAHHGMAVEQPYHVLEGIHRYNAMLREQAS